MSIFPLGTSFSPKRVTKRINHDYIPIFIDTNEQTITNSAQTPISTNLTTTCKSVNSLEEPILQNKTLISSESPHKEDNILLMA